ncbi:20718_t:CDS:2, partial [Rhizophagus irregularis]
MENQESSANTEVPFDVTEITTDDINMEDFSTQSSDMTKKASSGVIKTLITQDLFKEMGKPTSSTVDVTKPVDSENQTPMNDDVTLMDELGLLDREKQSLSKTADVVKETSDLALLRLLALHL